MPAAEEPLIWTSKGNVPVSSLEHYIAWEDTPTYVKFREVYKDKATGEVVKESAHVLARQGEAAGAQQTQL
jgi:hypothetical protein